MSELSVSIVELIRAHCEGREPAFRSAAMSLASRAKNPRVQQEIHNALSKRPANPTGGATKQTAPSIAARSHWLQELEPLDIDDLHLPQAIVEIVSDMASEDAAAQALMDRGLEPRNRLLLHGPPGNGKTSLARAIGGLLQRPVVALAQDVVGKHLGETSARLTELSRALAGSRDIVLIDELDSIGTTRSGDGTDCAREDARTTNALLTLLDRTIRTWIVATTNRLDIVDPALVRRFDEVIELPAPNATQLVEHAQRLAAQFQVDVPDVSDCVNFDAVTKRVRTSARQQIVREHARRVA
jgi:ATP-dependent 26S proteasome regulatory subunit